MSHNPCPISCYILMSRSVKDYGRPCNTSNNKQIYRLFPSYSHTSFFLFSLFSPSEPWLYVLYHNCIVIHNYHFSCKYSCPYIASDRINLESEFLIAPTYNTGFPIWLRRFKKGFWYQPKCGIKLYNTYIIVIKKYSLLSVIRNEWILFIEYLKR